MYVRNIICYFILYYVLFIYDEDDRCIYDHDENICISFCELFSFFFFGWGQSPLPPYLLPASEKSTIVFIILTHYMILIFCVLDQGFNEQVIKN